MWKIIVTLIVVVMAVIFTIQNSEHVDIQFIIGPAVKVRMIFLLMSFFVIGAVSAYIVSLKKEARLTARINELKRQNESIMMNNFSNDEEGA
ncbi:MAG: LapA family protein [Deltaproteobacteria bacterium]|nr:LapA family protein [Deltaproteobacteria bacterium]